MCQCWKKFHSIWWQEIYTHITSVNAGTWLIVSWVFCMHQNKNLFFRSGLNYMKDEESAELKEKSNFIFFRFLFFELALFLVIFDLKNVNFQNTKKLWIFFSIFRFLRFLFFELLWFLYSKHPNFRWIITITRKK